MGIQFLLFFWTKRINSLDRTTEKCSWHFDPFSISLFKIVVINEKYSIHESLNTQLTFCIMGFSTGKKCFTFEQANYKSTIRFRLLAGRL